MNYSGRIFSNLILSLAIGITITLFFQVLKVPWPPLKELFAVWSSGNYWSLIATSFNDFLFFKGAYLQYLWGVLVYFSMTALILRIGKVWLGKLDLRIQGWTSSLSLLVQWTLGTATMSLIWFFLCLFGTLSSKCALLLFFCGLIFGCIYTYEFFKKSKWSLSWIAQYSTLERTMLFIILGMLFVYLFPAFVPESWFDALVYHLGLPSYYIANKEFVPSPYNIFSYLNQNSEMLFLWSLLMKSEVALKLLNWTFLVMTLVAVYTFVKIFSDIYCGLVAVLFVLMMPIVTFQAQVAGNDLQMALQLLTGWILSLVPFLFLKFSDGEDHPKELFRVLFLSGCSYGASFGTKYNALVTVFCCFMGSFILVLRNFGFRKLVKWFLPCLIGFSIFSAPWMLRNFFYTGNPVYPFVQKVFNKSYVKPWHSSENTIGTGEKSKGTGVLLDLKQFFRETIGMVQGTPTYQVGWIFGMFLVTFISFFYKERFIVQMTFLISLASFVILSFQVLTPRYLLISYLLITMCMATNLINFSSSSILRGLIFIFIFSNVFFHGFIEIFLVKNMHSFTLLTLGATPERFELPTSDIVMINHWMKKNSTDQTRVLMMGIAMPYPFEKPFLYSSPLDVQYIDEALDRCSSPLELKQFLEDSGFHYILYSDLWSAYINSTHSKMTQEKIDVLKAFFKEYLTLLNSQNKLKLFKII
ncbi:MAG: hypothetical protein A3I11_03580 [Elusimicrobia bacterium RIFCSPLOWO2_02_FULL_39_32]|nr:MAG: hypothetical protein A2034_00240 [Elusimicrobia bacterium GWA2_38_7]OGR79462.1 MAG: hypothetical protein A3B80_02150 [Elusimicrobia bacterium RIFCSPHIGHO2_02_FULL_39_36]OGR92789.1 MAG: hypothetical protein A3I11_03580 [Elusimicrobia bacterium RIFCSPLOWO2_02_FULL_39_32]OGR99573.1 MAG: hypothetical protein A3G85_00935 [Elusimicrobia bacterium RIFCSPLOWO2_12_FULL_39_28]